MTTEEAARFNATVGKQLRAEIAAAGSSLSAMARVLGMSRSALDNYVTGKRAIPVPVAYEICDALGLDIQTVMDRAQERFLADRPGRLTDLGVSRLEDHADVTINSEEVRSAGKLAAKKGRRKADEAPWAE